MVVAGQFRPVLAGSVYGFRSVVDFTADLALDDGCIDERRLCVRMRRRVTAGSVLDQNPLDALAGGSGKGVLLDERYLDVLRAGKPDRIARLGFVGQGICRGYESQGGQRADRPLHGFLPSSEVVLHDSCRELFPGPIGKVDSTKLRLSRGYQRKLLDRAPEVTGLRIGVHRSVVAHHA
jgi:hypothetical protein